MCTSINTEADRGVVSVCAQPYMNVYGWLKHGGIFACGGRSLCSKDISTTLLQYIIHCQQPSNAD